MEGNNQYTATVYGYIKDQNYVEAVRILQVCFNLDLRIVNRSGLAVLISGDLHDRVGGEELAQARIDALVVLVTGDAGLYWGAR